VCVCVCVCACACTQVGRLEDEKREAQATQQLYLLTELQREQEVRVRGSWRKGGWGGFQDEYACMCAGKGCVCCIIHVDHVKWFNLYGLCVCVCLYLCAHTQVADLKCRIEQLCIYMYMYIYIFMYICMYIYRWPTSNTG